MIKKVQDIWNWFFGMYCYLLWNWCWKFEIIVYFEKLRYFLCVKWRNHRLMKLFHRVVQSSITISIFLGYYMNFWESYIESLPYSCKLEDLLLVLEVTAIQSGYVVRGLKALTSCQWIFIYYYGVELFFSFSSSLLWWECCFNTPGFDCPLLLDCIISFLFP